MVPSRNPDLPQAVKHGAAAGSLDCTHDRSLQQRGGEALQLHAAGRVGQSAPWAGLLLRQRAPKHLTPPTAALADTPWGALLPARRRLARLLQPAKDEGVTCYNVSVSIRQPDGDGDRQCSSGHRTESEHAADAGQAAAHGILSQPPKVAMTTAGAGSACGPQAPVSHPKSLLRIIGGNTSGSSNSSSPSQQCQCASTTVGACAVAAPLFPTASRTAFLPCAPYGSSVSQQPQALSTAPLGAGAVDSAIAPTPVVSARAASCCSVSQQRVTAAGPVAARGLSLASATVIASTAAAASSHCSLAPERAAPWVMGAAPHATAAASSSASSCCSPAASSTTLARASAAYAATLPASASAATGVPVHGLCSHPWSTPTAIAPSGAWAGRAAFRPLVCGGFSTPVCSSAGGWQGPMGGSVGKRGTTRLRAGNQRARACASAA